MNQQHGQEARDFDATCAELHRLGDAYQAGRLTRRQFTQAARRAAVPWNGAARLVLFLVHVEERLGQHLCGLWSEHDCSDAIFQRSRCGATVGASS